MCISATRCELNPPLVLGAGQVEKKPSKRDSHPENHRASNPELPMKTLDSTSTRSRHKWYHGTSKSAIPPCRRWISQAPTLDAQFHKHPLESNPAIPPVDAQFHWPPLQTHINGIKAHRYYLPCTRKTFPQGDAAHQACRMLSQ